MGPPSSTPRPAAQGYCANNSTVLWKPIDLRRIAVYSVGCEHNSADDVVQFYLRVLDKPSFLPPSPLKILP